MGCVEKVEAFYKFKKVCEESHAKLLGIKNELTVCAVRFNN